MTHINVDVFHIQKASGKKRILQQLIAAQIAVKASALAYVGFAGLRRAQESAQMEHRALKAAAEFDNLHWIWVLVEFSCAFALDLYSAAVLGFCADGTSTT